ncbi:MAG: hypothetical protein Q4B14_05720 [Clostridia bacterium]|nr:hypothetical protein [Clostridia bacterium]
MAIFTNQATLTYNGNVVNSNITTGELMEVLSATKIAVLESYSRGSDVTYAINIVNSAATAYSGLTITDNLGAYTFNTTTLVPMDYVADSVRYYVNGVLQASPAVTAGPPLVFSGITVPAGGVATILYVARANQFAPLDQTDTINNTATIGSPEISDITVTESISPENQAELNIIKTMSPTTITENGRLTYTFTIQNTGNTEATVTDAVSVSDIFNPILTDLSVTFNDTSWVSPTNYTYSETTGAFSTVAGQITAPAATYTQDPTTGDWIIEPGISVLTVTGTINV